MFKGSENAITVEKLKAGEDCYLYSSTRNLEPVIKAGQCVHIIPVTEDVELNKEDVVLCRVNTKIYLHKISAIRNKNSYLITDNYDNKRGWIGRVHIYGKVDNFNFS